jgi:hypothetical protein
VSRNPLGQIRWGSASLAIVAGLLTFLIAQPALPCSVCAGDPNSTMVQGVQAGVLVLLGVVGVVLSGVAAMLLFWVRRAANLKRLDDAAEQAG